MNQLDVAFLLGVLLAAIGGWRLGFVQRVAGWAGLVVGVVVASRLLPTILSTPATPSPYDLAKSLGIVAVGGVLGQTVGHFVGRRVRRMMSLPTLGVADSVGGSVLGVVGLVVASWMFLPTMVRIPGWPAETARGSVVAGQLTRVLGRPPDVLAGVDDALGVKGLGEALEGVRDLNLEPVAPADDPIPPEVMAAVRPSVVKLSGPACGRQQSGSGFVIASGVVVTNAHVVAGTTEVRITGDAGLDVAGSVHYLDIRNDIALVVAAELDRPPLALSRASDGDRGSVLGYPGGGPLTVQPYSVAATITASARDIYEGPLFSRRIVIVGTRIGPGDSGGPLVAPDGTVTGVAFGIAPDDDQTAYAIPSALLDDVGAEMSPEPVSTGPCLG